MPRSAFIEKEISAPFSRGKDHFKNLNISICLFFFSEKLNIAQPFLNQCQDLNVSLTFKAQRLSEGVARALGAPAASAERWSSVPSTLSSGSPLPTAPVLGI